ncbi:MAG: sugar transferase, partial [Verrucomicrobiota bacterium]
FFVMISWVCVLLSVLSWRYFLHRLFARLDILKKIERRILLVGWSDEAETLVNAVRRTESHPYTLHGCVMTRNDDESTIAQSIGRNLPILGKLAELETIIKRDRPEMVVVLDLDLSREDLLQVAHLCEVLYVEFKVAPSMFQTFESGLHLETIAGFPVLGVADLPINQLHGLLLKRTVDIVGALVGLSLAAPIMAVLALLIRRESPGPVIYRQTRTGKGGRPFTIYKMRSMRLDAEATTGTVWAVKDDPRRLRIGTFMRSTNLDELPQFWNVLKGDMSLVGPRPERPELIEKFEREIPHYNPRHLVKPGITGWAQVNGLRGDTSLTERIRYDLYYIENWSVFLDFQIMVLTFFKRDNAY